MFMVLSFNTDICYYISISPWVEDTHIMDVWNYIKYHALNNRFWYLLSGAPARDCWTLIKLCKPPSFYSLKAKSLPAEHLSTAECMGTLLKTRKFNEHSHTEHGSWQCSTTCIILIKLKLDFKIKKTNFNFSLLRSALTKYPKWGYLKQWESML